MSESVNSAMRAIKALDPAATLCLSDYTGNWYVSARVGITDGTFVTGITEHRAAPGAAVHAFLKRCRMVSEPKAILLSSRSGEQARAVRWDGSGWTTVKRPGAPS